MDKLKQSEIHRLALEILEDVADYCERSQIDYFISCGTLLGAVRHGGFIPWDHDVDIVMPRESYERFLSSYRTTKNFRIISPYTNYRVHFAYAKVFSYDTSLLLGDGTLLPCGVNIDIFPLDSFDSEQQKDRIFRKVKPVKEAELTLREIDKAPKPKAALLKFLKDTHMLNRLVKAADRRISINNGQKGDFMSVIMAPTHKTPEVFKREELFPTRKEGSFEGHTFRVPYNADRYLTLLYGDYMKLPPLEKIKAMGVAPVYWKD